MSTKKMLYILRHGEAEMAFGAANDFNRSLTNRGIAQLERLVKILNQNMEHFDLILSSSAVRTEMTSRIVEKNANSKVEFKKELYEARPEKIMDLLLAVDDEVKSLLVIGHNPGVSTLTSTITGEPFINLNPGMLAKIELEVDSWKLLGQNTGNLLEILQ
jgi:phosphohistidine phosphatase